MSTTCQGPCSFIPYSSITVVKYYVSKDSVPEIEESNVHSLLCENEGSEGSNDKPIMFLNDFSFFDPKLRNELISLAELEKSDGILSRQCEGVGDVRPYIQDDEDAGQEDDWEDNQSTRTRLCVVWRYTIDYTKRDE